MGTPGGTWSIIPGSCCHKLPTSCLLTSTTQCCACEDKRIHTPTYSIYIDGIGMTPMGKRWQNYCWPCKSFWDARAEQSSIPTRETHIPQYPDQSLFLHYWYSFYLGFNLTDGTPLDIGEPWREVDSGTLPRTATEIAEQRHRSTFEEQIEREISIQRVALAEEATVHQNIEDAMDQLLLEAENEEAPNLVDVDERILAPAIVPIELEHDAVGNPRHQEVSTSVSPTEDRQSFNIFFETMMQALQQQMLADEQDTAAQNITETRTHNDGPSSTDETPPEGDNPRSFFHTILAHRQNTAAYPGVSNNLEHIEGAASEISRAATPPPPYIQSRALILFRNLGEDDEPTPSGRIRRLRNPIGLDVGERPQPLKEEELMVKMECAICYHQKANIACLPCGHVVMCQWCADQEIPGRPNDSTIPAHNDAKCPTCRTRVKKRVKLFFP